MNAMSSQGKLSVGNAAPLLSYQPTNKYFAAEDSRNNAGYYLLSSSLTQRERYEEAFKELKFAVATIEDPLEDIVRLKAYLCLKINPPNIVEARETFDDLVHKHPEDMNMVCVGMIQLC